EVDGSTAVVPTDSWTGTITAESSAAMFALDADVYGEVAEVTWGICAIADAVSVTEASNPGSCTLAPGGATATICAEVPLTCGNVRASESSASCDWVPGIV